jgi:HTH-like domain
MKHADIIELARQYGRYGYRKIAELLRRTGWLVNDKRVEPYDFLEERTMTGAKSACLLNVIDEFTHASPFEYRAGSSRSTSFK